MDLCRFAMVAHFLVGACRVLGHVSRSLVSECSMGGMVVPVGLK